MSEGETDRTEFAWFEIDEGDPVFSINVELMDNEGNTVIAGCLPEPEPGRYELRRVDDAE